MFVLWSARAAAAERALAPGQAAGSRALVPSPLWASAGGTSRFSGPRAFPVESPEWAGWCHGPKPPDLHREPQTRRNPA